MIRLFRHYVPRGLLLLAVQAPLIGGLVAGVWSNVRTDSPTLYFVLVLSAFFLGAVNSAREIVKERALFLREKNYNLSTGAYVVSALRFAAAADSPAARGLFRVSLLYLPVLLLVLTLDGRPMPVAEPGDTPTLTVGGAPIGG